VCAGSRGSGTLGGDSGGPLLLYNNNRAFAIGITAFGDYIDKGRLDIRSYDQNQFPGMPLTNY
jgi:secreted trypsin-like serine protease